MKAALIGGGFSGNIHAAALRAAGIGLEAVVTSRPDTAKAFAEKWGIPRWGTDPGTALGEGIDAVHICTPPALHASYIKEALAAGKLVLCDKPLCFSPEQAREIAALARKSGNRCAVVYNVRCHMAVRRARELIQSGAFGRPLLIHGSYLQEFHLLPAAYDWRYDPETSGGMRAVTEIGSHWFDTVQYVSGIRISAVSALFKSFSPDRILKDGIMEKASPGKPEDGQRIRVDSEDAAVISLRFENGAAGSVLLSEVSQGRGNRIAFEITCEEGNLWWNGEENNLLHTAKRGEGIRTEVFAFGNGFQDTFAELFCSFYERGEGPSFEEGAQVTEVCAAAARSAAAGSAWMEVPLLRQTCI